jgi:hypothetical protein
MKSHLEKLEQKYFAELPAQILTKRNLLEPEIPL